VTVDTPEGARITTQSTDGDPRAFALGDDVEFALRVFHTAKNVPHYSWKVRKA
ncbi:MAG: hydroxymethylglutaryl-CoA synthase, partial [Ardenticatenia bacterium]